MTYGVSTSGLRLHRQTNDNFTVSQSDIDKNSTNRLHYYKNLQKQLDAQSTKASSIALRKQWLLNQKKINYQSEYDRVRSQIAHNTVKGLSIDLLKKRSDHLAKLGSKAINGIAD